VYLPNKFVSFLHVYTHATIAIDTSFEIGFDSLACARHTISLQPHTYTLCILCVLLHVKSANLNRGNIMSDKQMKTVSISVEEHAALLAAARNREVGSAVLLRNKKDESKYTLHGGILIDRALCLAIMEEIDASVTKQAQLDFSMNQSQWMKHDRLDPEGTDIAPAFWVEDSSDFAVETFTQHVQRDPDSAYDMLAPKSQRSVSVGAKSRKSA